MLWKHGLLLFAVINVAVGIYPSFFPKNLFRGITTKEHESTTPTSTTTKATTAVQFPRQERPIDMFLCYSGAFCRVHIDERTFVDSRNGYNVSLQMHSTFLLPTSESPYIFEGVTLDKKGIVVPWLNVTDFTGRSLLATLIVRIETLPQESSFVDIEFEPLFPFESASGMRLEFLNYLEAVYGLYRESFTILKWDVDETGGFARVRVTEGNCNAFELYRLRTKSEMIPLPGANFIVTSIQYKSECPLAPGPDYFYEYCAVALIFVLLVPICVMLTMLCRQRSFPQGRYHDDFNLHLIDYRKLKHLPTLDTNIKYEPLSKNT